MIADKMVNLVNNSSVIRAMFEEGRRLAGIYGADKVYDIQYFEDTYVVTGHTPTQGIMGNPRPGYVYRENHHIAIDCGCNRRNGRLAAVCLDTGREYYVEKS